MRSTFITKSWYTLAEASRQLVERYPSSDEATVLQLAVEGQLTMSVVFSDRVPADLFQLVREEDLSYVELPLPSGKGSIKIPDGGAVVYALDGRPYQATGQRINLGEGSAFDLAMIGGEAADVQDRLWALHGKPREETSNIDGTFCSVEMEAGPALLRLMEPFEDESEGYYPMGRLPSTAMLVVAHEDLVALLEAEPGGQRSAVGISASGPAQAWPWGSHRTKLLSHLEAAARRFWVNFDPSDSSTAPTNEQVSSWLQTNGVSQRNADVMATILRADGLPTGPRKG